MRRAAPPEAVEGSFIVSKCLKTHESSSKIQTKGGKRKAGCRSLTDVTQQGGVCGGTPQFEGYTEAKGLPTAAVMAGDVEIFDYEGDEYRRCREGNQETNGG